MQLSTLGLTLAPDAAIDLHTHTTYSDGKWAPAALIDYAAHAHFGLLAITDHDRVDTLATLQQLAIERGMPVLVGVEMTCTWQGALTDILCYGLDPEKNAFSPLTQDLLERQRANTRLIVQRLVQKGYNLPELSANLAAILAAPAAQQPHDLVEYLEKQGVGTADAPAWQLIADAGFAFQTHDIAAVIEAAQRSGALCVLAHPGRSDGFVCYDAAVLDEFRREFAIDGIEAYYPLHSAAQTALYLDYADRHALFISAGSDSHSPDKKPIPYRAECSRNLLARLGVPVRAGRAG